MGRSQRHLYQEQGYASDGTGFDAIVGGGEPPPVELPAPIITALTPPSAVTGDASVELLITGTGFMPGATITFDGVADDAILNSDTEIQALIDVSTFPAGSYPVVVINPDEQTSAGFMFEVTDIASRSKNK